MPSAPRNTVSAHVAVTLAQHIDHVFGVMGNGNAYFLDALERQTSATYTAVRHEAGGVVAADTHYRASGRIAAATATYGAGFTNTLTALAEAVQARIPLVLVVGDEPTSGPRPWDVDQIAMASGVGARTYTVGRTDAAATVIIAIEHALAYRAYGLLVSAIRDDDPTVVFAPAVAMGLREDVTTDLVPVPLGSARVHRPGTDVTVVALGHLVTEALAVADDLAGEISVEVFDPRTVFPFDWAALAESVNRTGRLVVADDSNRFCGFGAEVVAVAAEEMRLLAPPRRVSRPDGAVLPFALALDRAVQPNRDQLTRAIRAVMK